MPIEVTSANIENLWNYGRALRDGTSTTPGQTKLFEYYAGDQDILDETTTRLTGGEKNLVVTNWVKYVVDRHVGFLTSRPFKYTISELAEKDQTEAEKALRDDALANLLRFYRDQNLDANDSMHLAHCLLGGFSVELVTVGDAAAGEDAEINFTPYSPLGWTLVWDENDNLEAAVYRTVLQAGMVLRGELLTEDRTIYWFYDATRIIQYEASGTAGVVTQVDELSNNLGRIPLVVFGINETHSPFIDKAFVSQQNVYNKTRSRNADDVEYNVDALLCIMGYPPDALYEKAPGETKTYADKFREDKIIVITNQNGEKADAKFLTKGNDHAKVGFDLNLSREALHIMGRCADLHAMVGATGQTSGIALKLKLQPQIEAAGSFFNHFETGLRDRVEIVNAIQAARGKPVLDEYTVAPVLNIPVNEQEIWQQIPSIEGHLAEVDLLGLIPSVVDPEAAAERKRAESEMLMETAQIMGGQDEETQGEEDEQTGENDLDDNAGRDNAAA